MNPILKLMEGRAGAERSATARVAIGYVPGASSKVRVIDGSVRGRIADTVRGSSGFGWDAIFIPDGADETYAEMSQAEKNRTSMRARAAETFRSLLGTRERPPAAGASAERRQVMISYSRKDEAWRSQLATQLGTLEAAGLLTVWDDTHITTGADWLAEITRTMSEVRVGVFLVSPDFLTSDFILREEVPTLLERQESQGLKLYPILVRPCPYQEIAWLSHLQLQPRDGKALAGRPQAEVEELLAGSAREILELIQAR